MSRKHHYLKTETRYYQAVERGEKQFEFRKNDRDFKKYDMLHLQESLNGEKTGRYMDFEVTYILHGGKFGLPEGYCIMQLGSSGN